MYYFDALTADFRVCQVNFLLCTFIVYQFKVLSSSGIENLKRNKMLNPLGQACQNGSALTPGPALQLHCKQTPSLRSPIN